MTSGIRGWERKIEKRKKHNIPFYRLAQETVEERLRKKLTEKESWYKDNIMKTMKQHQLSSEDWKKEEE